MTSQKKSGSPFANVLQFYSEQAEKLTPVIKQGVDDWFTVYTKIWREGMRLQSELIQQMTGNKESSSVTNQVKNLGEKIIEIQKELSTGIVNAGMKSVKSILEAAKKSEREAD